MQTEEKLHSIAKRHEDRERRRAKGKRVCEEGEWPQHWKEGCKACGCGVGEVGRCSLRLCRDVPGQVSEPEVPPPTLDESQVGKRLEKLARRTMAEHELEMQIDQKREDLRAAGGRVCEDGDWPQEWWDGCQWCWCGESQIRQCESAVDCDPEVRRKLGEIEIQRMDERIRKHPRRVVPHQVRRGKASYPPPEWILQD